MYSACECYAVGMRNQTESLIPYYFFNECGSWDECFYFYLC